MYNICPFLAGFSTFLASIAVGFTDSALSVIRKDALSVIRKDPLKRVLRKGFASEAFYLD